MSSSSSASGAFNPPGDFSNYTVTGSRSSGDRVVDAVTDTLYSSFIATSYDRMNDNSLSRENVSQILNSKGDDMDKKEERDEKDRNKNINSSSSSIECKKMSSSDKGQLFMIIENMLLTGKREEAALLASRESEWALALVIASNCGPSTYKEISKAYAISSFPRSSPLYLATLLFSNQVKSKIYR